MSIFSKNKKPNSQIDETKDLIREEVKLALAKFEDIRFSSEYQKNIDALNRIISLGEELLITTPHHEFNDVIKEVAYYLIIPYDERARYYRHFGYYDRSSHPKNIQQSIYDYTRLLELLPLAGDEEKSNENYSRRAYEGRCECYLEIGLTNSAILDAHQLVNEYKDTQSYILRSKCYFLADTPKLAYSDIAHAIEIAKQQRDLAEALELQKAISKKYENEKSILYQVQVNGNVSESNIIIGNENTIQNSKEEK